MFLWTKTCTLYLNIIVNQTFNRKFYWLIVPLENCDFWQIFTDHHFLASLASYLPSQLDFPQPFSLTCPTPPSPPGPKRRILSISLGLDSWLFVPSYLFVYLLKVFIPVCPLQTQFWRNYTFISEEKRVVWSQLSHS